MFLTDRDILLLIDQGHIAGVPPRLVDPYVKESNVQPCSIDLKIGRIFVPGVKENEPGGAGNPKTEQHVLKPGETAVVEAREGFDLPVDIAGFGFPPARVSRNGFLMTNPGHVDPGFQGRVSFTLVNMGREVYALEPGDDICTVLLFRLATPPERDYRLRGPHGVANRAALLRRLSLDFLAIDERAKGTAQRAVKDAQLRLDNWKVWVPLLVGVLTLVGSMLGLFVNVGRLEADFKKEIATLRADQQIDKRLSSLETQLQELRRQSPAAAQPRSP